MKYAAFETMAEAREHRGNMGGWIFASDDGEFIWFSLSYTPTPIMLHPAVRGRSGRLY